MGPKETGMAPFVNRYTSDPPGCRDKPPIPVTNTCTGANSYCVPSAETTYEPPELRLIPKAIAPPRNFRHKEP